MPHLHRSLTAVKVGLGAMGLGMSRNRAGAVALSRETHLSDDEAVAKMGHPGVVGEMWATRPPDVVDG